MVQTYHTHPLKGGDGIYSTVLSSNGSTQITFGLESSQALMGKSMSLKAFPGSSSGIPVKYSATSYPPCLQTVLNNSRVHTRSQTQTKNSDQVCTKVSVKIEFKNTNSLFQKSAKTAGYMVNSLDDVVIPPDSRILLA